MNFALARPASQSSTYRTYIASKAVDGNSIDDLSCSITGSGNYQPWWKVELAHAAWISHVEITNKLLSGEYWQSHVDTMKSVCNDHLYNKIHYLLFIE